MPQRDAHPFYRALLRLYPKAHRQEYGEQMVQTLEDLLADRQDASGKMEVWLRIAFELPRNLAEEHINNIRGINMSDMKPTTKKILLAVSAAGVIVIAVIVVLVLRHHDPYEATTLAKVPRSANPPACLQDSDNPSLSVKPDDRTFIENNVVGSIIDVPAGTNVDVHLKSYDGSDASGTAIYSGKYGRYNFIAKKTADNARNGYVGGWTITRFEACKG